MTSIMVVDDDQDLAEMLGIVLTGAGYEVDLVNRGDEVMSLFTSQVPDLVLLDVMLPGLSGVEVCKLIREVSMVPIVMLSAKGDKQDIVAGLEAGADDYISKPIRPRVLMSRLKAILRRRNAIQSTPHESIDFGDLKIDRERFVVEFKGKTLQFPRKEFELLSFLASRPGRVFSRDEILENVWGNEVLVVDRTIDVHVRKIREKLDEGFIYTVKGVGYKFEPA